jgi:transcriptional regulator with XRE-family HTH domain
MATPGWDESFATMLTRLRHDAGLTQERLADRSGLSVRAISSLECGERRPRRYTLERLAQALGLPPDQRAIMMATAERDRRRLPDTPSVPTALAGPLVGRGPDLGELRAHLVGTGPAVLGYAGEPGIGKSRLLAEAVAVAADWGIPILAAGARRWSTHSPITYAAHPPAYSRRSCATVPGSTCCCRSFPVGYANCPPRHRTRTGGSPSRRPSGSSTRSPATAGWFSSSTTSTGPVRTPPTCFRIWSAGRGRGYAWWSRTGRPKWWPAAGSHSAPPSWDGSVCCVPAPWRRSLCQTPTRWFR